MFDESLLHFIWQHQLFNRENLRTEAGEELQIIRQGSLNAHGGPDFFNGQIRIGEMLWVGNIELHLNSSHWYTHQHQHDPAYDKVILHVVWDHDKEVFRSGGLIIPVLALNGLVKKSLIDNYHQLRGAKKWIPCEDQFMQVDSAFRRQMLDRMLINRLERKSKRIEQLLSLHKNDWEAVFYQLMARYFGFHLNALPFELLAIHTPFQFIRPYFHRPFQLKALLFGQAGFLTSQLKCPYHQKLKREYAYLCKLHHLKPMDVSIWKYLRMRPSNFPELRIAQFADLLTRYHRPFSKVQTANSLAQIHGLLSLDAGDYWSRNSRFGVKRKKAIVPLMGKSSRESLIINVIVPLLFCWSRNRLFEEPNKVLEILSELPAEQNSQIRKWQKLGWKAKSAMDTQAIMELRAQYCELKKCLTCTVGNVILKN